MSTRTRVAARLLAAAPLLLVLVPLFSSPRPTGGQDLGSLLSPGRLSKAHARLEGLDNCQKCHEPGRKVTAEKCLACHQPVAERIAAKTGVHRDVKGDCVSCHVEHAGADAELRPFDPKKFNHAAETGFALDGKHAPLAANCQSCHKTRSFLTLQPACASCHADKHKGRMGPDCASCHSTAVAFKEAAKTFDHTKAAFPLTGAHASVACAKCHKTPDFRVAKFGACNDCHRDPHVKPLGVCASCHTTDSFKATRRIDHDKTGFPLVGKHAQVPCATCHVQPPTKVHLKAGRCADCHQDPHKGVFKGSDCASCHQETGFKPSAPFDHAQKTGYALDGRHATVPCASCHKGAAVPAGVSVVKAVVDFRGAKKDCASCHRDPHQGELGARCESCHTVKSFRVETFQHPKFPEFFQAGHATAPCESCHRPGAVSSAGPTSRLFKGVSTDCATCHKDPHMGQLGTTCQSCHTVRAWPIPAYKHRRPDLATFFASKHGTLACEQCHKPRTTTFPAGSGTAVVFKGVSSECASCHEDAHDGMLGKQCQTCHTLKTWKTASRAFHKNTIFPLEGQHLTTPCAACHLDRIVKGTPNRCYDCHWIRRKDDKFETRLGNECGDCHRPIGWNAVNWNHQQRTGFALGAAHTGLPCESCHKNKVFTGLSTDCASCHQKDYNATRNPNHSAAGFPTKCETCHRPTDPNWGGAQYTHQSFPLVGVHNTQPCAACHTNNVYAGTPRDCFGCHKTRYDATTNPKHSSAGFGTACETCHKATDPDWNQASFNHAPVFPLVGVHNTQPCATCHKNNVFTGTPRDCFGCHKTQYDATTNPKHSSAGFGTACETCHKATDPDWNKASFNHSQIFPLLGVHNTQPCAACHKNNVFTGTPRDCFGCHKTQYDATTNPKHSSAGFGTACETCHKATDPDWNKASFNHSQIFPLVGVHNTQPCAACHKNNVFTGTPRDCFGCHKTQYDATTNPKHSSAGFGTACETCHKATDPDWNKASFNHSQIFPLVGVHNTQPCAACHKSNVFTGTPRDCFGCHKPQYDATTNPKHSSAGFPTTCDTCHKATDPDWRQANFNHSQVFPLVGVHNTQPCAACHKNNVYAGTPRDCFGCHKPQYDATTSPKHSSAGFPTTCDTCHKATDADWRQANFNHSQIFPLVGVHNTQPCAACHKNNVYAGTPRDCFGCHKPQYDATTSPKHSSAGFSTTCENCHKATDANWNQGVFNHTQVFALVGVHNTQPCAACHKNNVYAGTPRDCFGCHKPQYDATTDPKHSSAGFPTTCEPCHKATDARWDQGVFNHTLVFPLLGVHNAQPCAACHKNGVYRGTPRDCYGCHKPQYDATTDPKHTAAGFSTTCDTCHKATDASWDQGRFNHASVFALVGVHSTQPCAACHKNNVYRGTPRDCFGCHKPQYDATTNPKHSTVGFPTTCETCHKATDGSWDQGTFNHTWFPIKSGPHANRACVDCHTNPSNYTVFTCTNCHGRSETDGHHRGVAGYRYDSVACYSCHPNGRSN